MGRYVSIDKSKNEKNEIIELLNNKLNIFSEYNNIKIDSKKNIINKKEIGEENKERIY